MGARAALIGFLALGLGACGPGAARGAVPEFAASLPGRTALVAWAGDGAPPPALAELVRALGDALGLEPVGAGGVVAYAVPAQIEVGWQRLADSTTFVAALALAKEPAPAMVFADLELLLESLAPRAHAPRDSDLQGELTARVARTVRRMGLRYLRLGFDPESGDGAGEVTHRPERTGLPNTLDREHPLVNLPEVAPHSPLQLEAAFVPESLTRLATALTRVEEGQGDWLGSMAGEMGGGLVRSHLLGYLRLLAGRVSLQVDPFGARAEFTVADVAAARSYLDRRLKNQTRTGYRLGPVTLQLVEDTALVHFGASRDSLPPRTVAAEPGTLLWCTFVVPGEAARRVVGMLGGGSTERTQVRFHVR